MRNLKQLLNSEPAAIGTLVASILPVLILLGAVRDLSDQEVAAIVVAVNTLVGFLIRLWVSPSSARAPEPEPDVARRLA